MDEEQREKVRQSWEKFLDPQSMRSNLISCSLFIVVWETFRKSVIEYLRGFYNFEHLPDRSCVSPNYQSRVLSRHRSPLTASLLWFQEMGAIEENDLDTFHRIREHRNDIVHHLPRYLSTIDRSVDIDIFTQLVELTAKIGRWWVLEIEIPTNPEFDNREIRAEEVQSGDMWFISVLLQIAAGDEKEAGAAYQQFRETWKAHGHNA